MRSCGSKADGQAQASQGRHSTRTALARNGNSCLQSTSGLVTKESWPDTDYGWERRRSFQGATR
eukprot:4283583-Pleurochrysis_carterae.AAC.1